MLRYFTLAVAVVIMVVVVGVLWVDEGEVVTLATVDQHGRHALTGLWIVELDGRTYLRAGSPDASWLKRLRTRPLVELTRGGVTRTVRATPIDDAAVRIAVSWAMREKYGLVDAVLVRIIDHSQAVPILVEPVVPDLTAGDAEGAALGAAP